MKKLTQSAVMASRQLAGRVTRYHTWPMIRKPTTNEHAARVAKLYVELWGMPRAEILYYCLIHDDGELAGGDTPFYAKRAVPELKDATDKAESMGLVTLGQVRPELTEDEFRRFKMADYLEMWETATVEQNMGNRYADVVKENLLPVIRKLAAELYWINGMHTWMEENDNV